MSQIAQALADSMLSFSAPTSTNPTANPLRAERSTGGAILRIVYRFDMPPANAINLVLRRYLASKVGSPGTSNIRLIDDHDPAIAFSETQACWNLPQTGENWGATPTGGGALTGVNTSYDGTARTAATHHEDSVQAQFEAALARGDAFFSLIEHLSDESTGSNASLRYESRESATTSPPASDRRPHLLYDLADITDPEVAITSHTDGQNVETRTITVSGTADDPDGAEGEDVSGLDIVELRLNGGSWEETTLNKGGGTWTHDVALEAGANTIEVRATDLEGNVSTIADITVTLLTHEVTLGPVIDAEMDLSFPDTNFGDQTFIPLGYAEFDEGATIFNVRALLKFSLAGLEAGVTEAILRLTSHTFTPPVDPEEAVNDAYATLLDPSRHDWEEMQVTWNSYKDGSPWTTPGGDTDGLAPTVVLPPLPAELGGTWEADITELVQWALDQERTVLHLFMAVPTTPNFFGIWQFRSREHETVGDRPILTLEVAGQGDVLIAPDTGTLRATSMAGARGDSPVYVAEMWCTPDGTDFRATVALPPGKIASCEIIGDGGTLSGTARVVLRDDLDVAIWKASLTTSARKAVSETDAGVQAHAGGDITAQVVLAEGDTGVPFKLRIYLETAPWP